MRASAKHNAGVAAECLLAAQGFEITDDDAHTARAYAGAILQLEAMAEFKALRKDIVTLIKALTRGN